MRMRSTPRAIVHTSEPITHGGALELQRMVRAALRTRRTVVVAGAQLHVEPLPRAGGPEGSVERTASRTIGTRARRAARARQGRPAQLSTAIRITSPSGWDPWAEAAAHIAARDAVQGS
jgi:hypothetical protein